ncbi:MAG TPA: sulfatase-like hydrolase/transferase [Mycobacteriales bacterium]|nr:sulfatase-like hydrolase/transferase [Mycobacteriales bacterium]
MSRTAGSQPRHLVLIVLDTARADGFAPYNPFAQTPAVQDISRSGLAHDHAIASCSWTLPSHVGMLFGQHHRALGLSKPYQQSAPAAHGTVVGNIASYLPDVLRRNGYLAVGVSANPWVSKATGFDCGFDEFTEAWRQLAGPPKRLPARLSRLWPAWELLMGQTDNGLSVASEVADRWLETAKSSQRPCMLFLNLMECHSPWRPPKGFNSLAPWSRAQAGFAMSALDFQEVWRINLSGELPKESELAAYRQLYDDSIRYVDRWLGFFMNELADAGILDDTLVVITSDHGENFGEGGLFGHTFSLDNRLVRVPLVFSQAPRTELGPTFSLVDLAGLLASELGVADHPYAPPRPSTIAVSQVEGVGTPDDERVIDFLARHGLEHTVERLTRDAICATDGRWKVELAGSQWQLFDLQADPLEVDPRPLDRVDPANLATLMRLKQSVERVQLRDRGRSESAPLPVTGTSDEALERHMKLLGYL